MQIIQGLLDNNILHFFSNKLFAFFLFSWLFLSQSVYGQYTYAGPITPNFLNGISQQGHLELYDNNVQYQVPLGFDFSFFGVSYNEVSVDLDGFISFMPTPSCCSGLPMPNLSTPNNVIALAWTEVIPTTEDDNGFLYEQYFYGTVGTAPNRVFWIWFEFLDACSAYYAGEIQLHEGSNRIEFHSYQWNTNGNACGNATQGIENIDGSVGFTVPGRNANNTWSITSEEAHAFIPQPPPPVWQGSPQIYVDEDATEGLQTGYTWDDAFLTLQDGIDAFYTHSGVNEIWVANGTYKPTTTTDRFTSFFLTDSIKIYGGFSGFETNRSQRSDNNTLVKLSGNIGNQSNSNDNCLHVVTIGYDCKGCILDGLTIEHGNANIDTNEIDSKGGGILCFGEVSLTNLTIRNNKSYEKGSAIFMKEEDAVVDLEMCTVIANSTTIFSSSKSAFFIEDGAELKVTSFNYIYD